MFADLSDLIVENPPARHHGVAVADVDADDRFEFVVAGFDGPNRVLRWTGDALRDLRVPALADPHRRTVGLAAGDIDGDGREELYVLNAEAEDRLWKRLPDGRWEDLFARLENGAVGNLAAGRSVAAIDRRGVGRYGFVVANVGARLRLYELAPDAVLTDLATPLELDRVTGCRGLLAAPVLSARTDLFCTNEGGPNFLFRNRGDGTFEEVASELGLADPDESGRGATAVDADGDGRLDLCWANADGPHRLTARRDGPWKDLATPALALPSAARTVIAADFDNDGRDELFFHNHGEPNRLFRLLANPDREGGGSCLMLDPGAALEPDGLGTAAAVADVDHDGVLELLVAHGESAAQPLSLYKVRGAEANGWLRIRPLTRFGAPARGAVVRLNCGGRVRVKLIDGGSGYLGQMEPVAHFGLGKEPSVESVTVTWPDGATLTMRDPDLNCTYRVPYPGG
jgi:hypothetical protein